MGGAVIQMSIHPFPVAGSHTQDRGIFKRRLEPALPRHAMTWTDVTCMVVTRDSWWTLDGEQTSVKWSSKILQPSVRMGLSPHGCS